MIKKTKKGYKANVIVITEDDVIRKTIIVETEKNYILPRSNDEFYALVMKEVYPEVLYEVIDAKPCIIEYTMDDNLFCSLANSTFTVL